MASSHSSPRKAIPLASGDELPTRIRTRSSGPTVTKRVFFCGVVVENAENGEVIPTDVQDFIASLGEPLDLGPESDTIQSTSEPSTDGMPTAGRRRAMTNASALADIVKELIGTERSYVSRLKTLKHDYADPLRTFARSKDTAILPPYEAKTLFGNIDNLLPVNEAFLKDLESIEQPNGPGIGDVALKHFKELKGFEHYKQYYAKREEAQMIFEREMRKSSGFSAFVDRIKYSSADTKNRVGLRELLMEPVQRVPRYTLLFRMMLKHMAAGDRQRALLLEAEEIASRIALAETDEQTMRAAIMYCLSGNVEDFPPALVSHGRRFIDCIDVEDQFSDLTSPSSSSVQASGNLHCSLFLFDDKLMIVKRPVDKAGRALAGLEVIEKLSKTGSLPPRKKSGLAYKGVVDITDVVATDVGGSDFHLYLETPPQDQTERWYGRPFRSFSVVQPTASIMLNPSRTEANKKRFLENLWDVQARYRTKRNQSVALAADEREVENRAGKKILARTYFNIYQRTAFLQEAKKTKVVLQIDAIGSADPIPFGMQSPPYVVVKVQPMAGELCRYKVTSSDPNDEAEEDIVQTVRVPERIVQTIHQFGLFNFRTGNGSIPSTPTTSGRSRAAMFGLDAISRNLFNSRAGSVRGELFSGSTIGHRRSKTTSLSRSSIYTTTTTGDSTFSRFSRISTSTAATSVMDDQSTEGSSRSRSLSRNKKLVKKRSIGGSDSEPEASPTRGHSRSGSSLSPLRSPTREREVFSDEEMDDGVFHMDESERDLARRLALARQNSQNQNEQQYAPDSADQPFDEDLYEDAPPDPVLARRSRERDLPELPRDAHSHRSTTPRPNSTTPTRGTPPGDSEGSSCSVSGDSRHQRDPRTPLPLSFTSRDSGPQMNEASGSQTPLTPIPRSRRQPFDLTRKAGSSSSTKVLRDDSLKLPNIIEPLSIKKKASLRTNAESPKKTNVSVRGTPLTHRVVSSRRLSGRNWRAHTAQSLKAPQTPVEEIPDRLIQSTATLKDDIELSRRILKKIKLETDRLRSMTPGLYDDFSRPSSPVKGLRPAPFGSPTTREAQARRQEIEKLFGPRASDDAGRNRAQSVVGNSTPPRASDNTQLDFSRIDELVAQADLELAKAVDGHQSIQADISAMTDQLKETFTHLYRTRIELRHAQRQCELVKSLLADCMTEKDILFEAFNEELDSMYNDANLPADGAWAALTKDLRQSKEARNALSRENAVLQRRIAEMEVQQEHYGSVLRAHGLIT